MHDWQLAESCGLVNWTQRRKLRTKFTRKGILGLVGCFCIEQSSKTREKSADFKFIWIVSKAPKIKKLFPRNDQGKINLLARLKKRIYSLASCLYKFVVDQRQRSLLLYYSLCILLFHLHTRTFSCCCCWRCPDRRDPHLRTHAVSERPRCSCQFCQSLLCKCNRGWQIWMVPAVCVRMCQSS